MRRGVAGFDFAQLCMVVTAVAAVSGCAPGVAQTCQTGDGPIAAPVNGELRSRNPESPWLAPMLDADLRSTFREVILSSTGDARGWPEQFSADGVYTKYSRVRFEGRFWIADDELCVEIHEHPLPLCRRFARDAEGRVYLTGFRDERGERDFAGSILMSITRPQ